MRIARDLMRRTVFSVSPETPAEEAIDLLVKHDVSGLPVVDSAGRVVGIFSEIDRIQLGNLEGRPVQHMMSKQVVTIDVQDSLVEVARVFRENGLRRLPVVEDGVMVGIIGLRDLVRYIRETELTLQGVTPVLQNWDPSATECWSNAD